MQISARNQLKGRITAVKPGVVTAEVTVAVEPSEVTAVITEGSVEKLGLKPGDSVTVIVKSTDVMIGK